jgi:hypothetical protein
MGKRRANRRAGLKAPDSGAPNMSRIAIQAVLLSMCGGTLSGQQLPPAFIHWQPEPLSAIETTQDGSQQTSSALAAGAGCADCTITTGDRAKAALVVTGGGAVVGFLAGLASAKYVWVQRGKVVEVDSDSNRE